MEMPNFNNFCSSIHVSRIHIDLLFHSLATMVRSKVWLSEQLLTSAHRPLDETKKIRSIDQQLHCVSQLPWKNASRINPFRPPAPHEVRLSFHASRSTLRTSFSPHGLRYTSSACCYCIRLYRTLCDGDACNCSLLVT